jgi:hypothetical protein
MPAGRFRSVKGPAQKIGLEKIGLESASAVFSDGDDVASEP